MNKNESFEIKPMMNGYLVDYSYRMFADKQTGDLYDRYEWMCDKYMFKTWDEVVDFVKNKPLDVPPAKINVLEAIN